MLKKRRLVYVRKNIGPSKKGYDEQGGLRRCMIRNALSIDYLHLLKATAGYTLMAIRL